MDVERHGSGGVSGLSGADAPAPPWLGHEVQRRMVSFARRYVRDATEAEDVVQDTLVRARGSLHRLRTQERAEAWLFRVCRHAAIDHGRKRRVRQQVWLPLSEELAERIAAGPRPAPGRAPGPWDVPRALARLPAHQRVLMLLHYERGLPQAAIGQLTGLSLSAVRVRLFRARGTLSQEPDLPPWAVRRRRPPR